MLYIVIFLLSCAAFLVLNQREGSGIRCRVESLLTEKGGGRLSAEQLKKAVLLVMVTDIAAMLLWIGDNSRALLGENGKIQREEKGQNTLTAYLYAENAEGEGVHVEAEISPRRYKEEELELLFTEMLAALESVILGENSSWEHVSKKLYLPERYGDYPFTLEWQSSPYGAIAADGVLRGQQATLAAELQLRAVYFDFEREYQFHVQIYPDEEEASFTERVQEALQQADQTDPEGGEVILPEEIDGKAVSWKEEKQSSAVKILVLGVFGAVLLCVSMVRQEENKKRKRQQAMELEYGAVIGKLSLYLSAGMNIRGAWEKITEEGRENPVYEEMQITCREMEGGIGEAEAYERFGRRLLLQRYIRLATLLVQNLQKGNAALLVQLHQEVLLSREELAAAVRKRGEEISTKLLLPMMLLLGIVMIWIMVPAFMSL